MAASLICYYHGVVASLEIIVNLTFLAVLACPLSMGLMMWMMRGGHQRDSSEDARIVSMQHEIETLRHQVPACDGEPAHPNS